MKKHFNDNVITTIKDEPAALRNDAKFAAFGLVKRLPMTPVVKILDYLLPTGLKNLSMVK